MQAVHIISFLIPFLMTSERSIGGEMPVHPNVLLICIDDLRPELKCYGAEHMLTPRIDALSAGGVSFDRFYVQVAVCNPSRASTWTGLRPDRLGVWTLPVHFREASPDAVTLPQYLRKNGYTCEGYGKIFHNPWPDPQSWDLPHQWGAASFTNYTPEQMTFTEKMRLSFPADSWLRRNLRGPITNEPDIPDSGHQDGALALMASERLKVLKEKGDPFFLAVGFLLPHLAWAPPKSWWGKYDREKIPLATNPYPPEGAPEVALGTNHEPAYYADMTHMSKPWEKPIADDEARRLRHAYFASVSFIDAQVGRLLDALESEGLSKNTVVILWSDHGYKLGEHNGWGKMTNYEIDTRIPFIIRDPRSKANGQRCNQLVESLDIFPTVCELTGVPVPESLDGKSAANLLNDPKAPHGNAAFSQFVRNSLMGASIRTDRWRYVEWREMKDGSVKFRELYDHQNDPDENRNVAGVNPQVIADLEPRLHKVLVPGPVSLIPRIRSEKAGEPVEVRWVNNHAGPLWLWPIDSLGQRAKSPVPLKSGKTRKMATRTGSAYAIESIDGDYHELVVVQAGSREIFLGTKPKQGK